MDKYMIVNIIITVIFLIIFDTFWFQWSLPNVYQPTFDRIGNTTFRLSGGIVAWMLIAAGLNYYAIIKGDIISSALRGALFGFIVYGVYNATNYAILTEYDLRTATIDTAWGMCVSGLVSALVSTI